MLSEEHAHDALGGVAGSWSGFMSTSSDLSDAEFAHHLAAAGIVRGASPPPLCRGGSDSAAAGAAAGAYADPGPRDGMEDRHLVVNGFAGVPGALLAGVFDGHRGWEAADFASAHLPRALQAAALRGTPAGAALSEAFVGTDAAFWREWQVEQHATAARSRMKERFPGCTALVALVAGGRLAVANAGDSRGVLCRGGAPVRISRDHTAAAADERARVTAAGGTLSWHAEGGGWRVGPAALQVTRSLGDFDLKGPTQGGVTSTPEVLELELAPQDEFFVLATDGLWDVLTEAEVLGLVRDTVKHPDLAAKRLVTEALARGSRDNVTALVAFLAPQPAVERVFSSAGGGAVHAITPTYFGTRR